MKLYVSPSARAERPCLLLALWPNGRKRLGVNWLSCGHNVLSFEGDGPVAKAFEVFAKAFANAYGIAAWAVVSSFDLKVVSKYGANSRYKLKPNELKCKMLESFLPLGGYDEIKDLVFDRFEKGTPVSDAITREAIRADEALYAADESTVGWGYIPSLLEFTAINFCFDQGFRELYSRALLEDGFKGDSSRLWRGIDRISTAFENSDRDVSEVTELIEYQREVSSQLLLSSLLGPMDFAQQLGYMAEGTLPPSRRREGVDGQEKQSPQLQPIVPIGINPWDYLTDGAPTILSYEHAARIGRDEKWCKEGGCISIVVTPLEASRTHCTIMFDGAAWTVSDCGSLNGTLVVSPSGMRRLLSDETANISGGDIICIAPDKPDSSYDSDCFCWAPGLRGVCFRFEGR